MSNAFEKFFKSETLNEPKETAKNEEKRVVGKIFKIETEEGWGFITSKDIKFTRIFFHWTSLKQETLKFQELRHGMRVEFTPVEVEGRGWRAIRIMVISDEMIVTDEQKATT